MPFCWLFEVAFPLITRFFIVCILALLGSSLAYAQSRMPGDLSTLPGSSPQEFDLLDNTGRWVPLGTASGGTISLINALDPRSFGAKCDGTTDDTAALATWAAAITNGSVAHVVGTCTTTQPIVFPIVDHVSLTGDGFGSSKLLYTGATTNVSSVFKFGSRVASSCSINQWTFKGLSFESNTKMTGGYAVEISDLCAGLVSGISIGNQFGGTRNWWSGIHFDGGNSVKGYGMFIWGQTPTSGSGATGLTVNGDAFHQFTDPNFHGVTLVGFDIGINIAGWAGGFVLDFSDILENNTQVRISQDVIATGNNQIFFGPSTFLDKTVSGPEVDVVDAGGSQPFLTFNDTWLASSFSHGLLVEPGTSWNILMNGGFVYNIGAGSSSIDGIHNESTTGKIWVNGVRFGATGGYCVNSTVANPNIVLDNPIFPPGADSQHCGTTFNSATITPVSNFGYSNGGELSTPSVVLTGRGPQSPSSSDVAFVPLGAPGPTDENNWDVFSSISDQSLQFRALNDAFSSSSLFAEFTRGSGFSLSGASFILNVPEVVNGMVAGTVFESTNVGPDFQWRPVGGSLPTDSKNWDFLEGSSNGNLVLRALNDDFTTAVTYMLITRGTTDTLTGASVQFNTPVIAAVYLISALPACNSGLTGANAYVTNGQTSPPYLGAVSATGSTVAPVFCNGSGWVYH